MLAYTAGIIAGALTAVFPLIYMMNYDRCVALILSRQPDFYAAGFSTSFSHITPALLSGIAVIGSLVLILSAAMAAITGFRRPGDATVEEKTEVASAVLRRKPGFSDVDTEEETEI